MVCCPVSELLGAEHLLAIYGSMACNLLRRPAEAAGAVAQVDAAAVQATVAMLAACLLRSDPGLACPLARNLTAVAGDPAAPRYVGILRTLAADAQDPDARVMGDVARLLWNFLALRTASGPARLASGARLQCAPHLPCMLHTWTCFQLMVKRRHWLANIRGSLPAIHGMKLHCACRPGGRLRLC